jgi:ABC-type uncharacterized transport system involved in gliding motility auxiliary subunit
MSPKRNYFKYLFFIGIVFTVAGLVVGLATKHWSLIPPILITIGLGLFLGSLLLLNRDKSTFWQQRSTVAGTNAIVTTIAVLAILGTINFALSRANLRVDLTENQIFSLAKESQELVRNLSQPLKLIVFSNQQDRETKDLLENYRRYGTNFQFEFVDPEIKIALTKEFNVKSSGEIYLQYGDKKQLLKTLAPGESLSEVELTNGIEKIQRARPEYVYFLQGHGEPSLETDLSQATTGLKNKGYNIEPLNLTQTAKIPDNANTVVVLGPKKALFSAEVKTLTDYLNKNGKLFLAIDPETNTGLDSLLKDWGVQLDNRFLIDNSGAGSILGLGAATALVNNYGNHPIAKDFKDGISVYPKTRAVEITEIKGIEAIPLVISNDKTWAESDLKSAKVQFDEGKDKLGPLNIAVVFARQQSKLIVFGNSTFATNNWYQTQLNGDIFLNSIAWLASDDKQTFSLRPKEPKNRRINLSAIQTIILTLLALVIMPLIGLLAGLIAWWRRR